MLTGDLVFLKPELYRLFKAMDAIETIDMDTPIDSNRSLHVVRMTLAPKYKILTEFVGHNFNNKEAVYCMRTDTAGRFFCLANTSAEQKIYDEAKELYMKNLAISKKALMKMHCG